MTAAHPQADWARLEALLDAALDLDGPGRERLCAELAAIDPVLAVELAELLAADRAAGDEFLAAPAAGDGPTLLARLAAAAAATGTPGASLPADDDLIGKRVGPWRVVAPLGQGGMGRVVVAERADGQYQQRVALKLLRSGFAGDELVRRFWLERQILAHLEHPAIARLLDGGLTDEGQPYFALELVDGAPLTEWCREHRLPLRDRLKLLVQVAEAVAYAHGRLVVHRDLKPSNVLVTGDGQPKLLDFGIAKLLDPAAAAGETRAELRLLTPEYAAPEQVLGEPVTTATDVYALGVLLYELLTGVRPHRREGRSSGELVRELDRETVERPSTRAGRELAKLEATLADGEARGWARRLAGDLDWIALAALRREPSRRYQSAAAFAEDLRRHLDGDPISAGPDTWRYRGGKWLRRHWRAVGAAALAMTSLLAGLAVAVQQARVARRAQQRAERVASFLGDLFERAEPADAESANRRAVDLIADGARQVEALLPEDPELAADLLATLAPIEITLGQATTARRHAETVLADRLARSGPDSLATARARAALASAWYELEGFGEARAELELAIAVFERAGGGAAEDLAAALGSLAAVHRARDEGDTADALYDRALAILTARRGARDPRVLELRRERAIGLVSDDRPLEAVAIGRELLAIEREVSGPRHLRTAVAAHDLAIALDEANGDPVETEAAFAEAISIRRQALGSNHPLLATSLRQYGDWLSTRARYAEAEAAVAEAESILRQGLPESGALTRALNARAILLYQLARSGEAVAIAREVAARFERSLGSDHETTLVTLSNLGAMLTAAGDLAAAEEALREVVARHRRRLRGGTAAELGYALNNLGRCLLARGRTDEAEPLHREALAIADRLYQTPHEDRVAARMNVAEALLLTGDNRLAEARSLLVDAIAMQRQLDASVPRLAGALALAGRVAVAEGRPGDAPALLREALAIQTARRGSDHPRAAEVEVYLAEAELLLGRRAEAARLVAHAAPILDAGGAGYAAPRADLERLRARLAGG